MYRSVSGILAIGLLLLIACNESVQKSPVSNEVIILQGEAQGTTYNIRYYDEQGRNLKKEIDSILLDFDNSLSTYNAQSIITHLNQLDSGLFPMEDPFGYLQKVYNRSAEIYSVTEGAFDPTVMPLVRGWGFGLEKSEGMDSLKVDSLLQYVSFEPAHLRIQKDINENLQFYKNKAGMALDFNAIAQGYSVDVLSDFLSALDIQNHLVELGGEVRAKGIKADQSPWKLGIDQPLENTETRALQALVTLKNQGMATSGNYRKFYEKDGVRYSHTLNPQTGFPVTHSLLSATVIAEDCASADAFATAFMVMGTAKTQAFLEAHPELKLEAYLIYGGATGWETWSTAGLAKDLRELK